MDVTARSGPLLRHHEGEEANRRRDLFASETGRFHVTGAPPNRERREYLQVIKVYSYNGTPPKATSPQYHLPNGVKGERGGADVIKGVGLRTAVECTYGRNSNEEKSLTWLTTVVETVTTGVVAKTVQSGISSSDATETSKERTAHQKCKSLAAPAGQYQHRFKPLGIVHGGGKPDPS